VHLFDHVTFRFPDDVVSWKKTFPDLASSSAYYTHSLLVYCLEAVTAADGEECGWIRPFFNVIRLGVWSGVSCLDEQKRSLAPFHNFSPALKSFRVFSGSHSLLPPSQVLDLVCSLPLVGDLSIVGEDVHIGDEDGTIFRSPTSPPLTGILVLYLSQGTGYIMRRLLGFPNGLHFREIIHTGSLDENLQWMMALVDGCSDTLGCSDIAYWSTGESFPLGCCNGTSTLLELPLTSENPPAIPLDFSKTMKLKRWSSGLVNSMSYGSRRHSRPSRPSIDTSNRSQFTSPSQDGLWRKRSISSGWTSTTPSSKSGSRMRSARRPYVTQGRRKGKRLASL
jgi:hypothetical protein